MEEQWKTSEDQFLVCVHTLGLMKLILWDFYTSQSSLCT